MVKVSKSAKLKGTLDILVDEDSGLVTGISITNVVKEQENKYDLLALLNEFDGKTITIGVNEAVEITPVEK